MEVISDDVIALETHQSSALHETASQKQPWKQKRRMGINLDVEEKAMVLRKMFAKTPMSEVMERNKSVFKTKLTSGMKKDFKVRVDKMCARNRHNTMQRMFRSCGQARCSAIRCKKGK